MVTIYDKHLDHSFKIKALVSRTSLPTIDIACKLIDRIQIGSFLQSRKQNMEPLESSALTHSDKTDPGTFFGKLHLQPTRKTEWRLVEVPVSKLVS